jgi:flagellar hook-basal body complex protein FliE
MDVGALSPLSAAGSAMPSSAASPSKKQSGFAAMLDRFLGGATELHASADRAVEDLVAGRTDNLHGVMLSVSQADLAFRTLLEIRNKLLEAYQEITRMQV